MSVDEKVQRLGGKDGDELCPDCRGDITSWYCDECRNTGLVKSNQAKEVS